MISKTIGYNGVFPIFRHTHIQMFISHEKSPCFMLKYTITLYDIQIHCLIHPDGLVENWSVFSAGWWTGSGFGFPIQIHPHWLMVLPWKNPSLIHMKCELPFLDMMGKTWCQLVKHGFSMIGWWSFMIFPVLVCNHHGIWTTTHFTPHQLTPSSCVCSTSRPSAVPSVSIPAA